MALQPNLLYGVYYMAKNKCSWVSYSQAICLPEAFSQIAQWKWPIWHSIFFVSDNILLKSF